MLTTPNADAHLYHCRGERFAVGPEHVALMGYRELLAYLDPAFEVVVARGYNVSMTPELDGGLGDPDVGRAWAALYEDRPDLASWRRAAGPAQGRPCRAALAAAAPRSQRPRRALRGALGRGAPVGRAAGPT